MKLAETWPALNPHDKVRFVYYDLVVDEDDTEVLVFIVVAKDHKIFLSIFITGKGDDGSFGGAQR